MFKTELLISGNRIITSLGTQDPKSICDQCNSVTSSTGFGVNTASKPYLSVIQWPLIFKLLFFWNFKAFCHQWEHFNVVFFSIITKMMVCLKIYDILDSGKHGVWCFEFSRTGLWVRPGIRVSCEDLGSLRGERDQNWNDRA